MKISLAQLRRIPHIEKLIIHSLDLSLFQASAIIEGQEYYITDDQGRFLRSFNKLQLQSQLQGLPTDKMVLRQSSAYDEMVGQPPREQGNCLEVELGNTEFAREPTALTRGKLH